MVGIASLKLPKGYLSSGDSLWVEKIGCVCLDNVESQSEDLALEKLRCSKLIHQNG